MEIRGAENAPLGSLIRLLVRCFSPIVLVAGIDVDVDLIRDVDGRTGCGTVECGDAVVEYNAEENNEQDDTGEKAETASGTLSWLGGGIHDCGHRKLLFSINFNSLNLILLC